MDGLSMLVIHDWRHFLAFFCKWVKIQSPERHLYFSKCFILAPKVNVVYLENQCLVSNIICWNLYMFVLGTSKWVAYQKNVRTIFSTSTWLTCQHPSRRQPPLITPSEFVLITRGHISPTGFSTSLLKQGFPRKPSSLLDSKWFHDSFGVLFLKFE